MVTHELFERARKAFGVLQHLEPELVERVVLQGTEVRMPEGEKMFHPGDSCDGFGFIVEGSIKVGMSSESGRELVLYRVRPGESCTVTVSCLVNDTPYPASGVVEEALTGVSVPKGLFNELIERSPVFRRFVLEIFSIRTALLLELVNQVAFNKLDQRLAARLLELGPVVAMTHQQLADELGTTREIVSRILESFADQGAVCLERKRISVEDSGLLETYSGAR